MLDFNDNDSPAHKVTDATREQLRASLIDRLESVLTGLFPAGKKRRGKFLIGDVLGSPGDSLEVVLDGEKAGLWTDRATGDGGDIFDLIAAYLGADAQSDFPRVLDYAAELVVRSSYEPEQPGCKVSRQAAIEVQFVTDLTDVVLVTLPKSAVLKAEAVAASLQLTVFAVPGDHNSWVVAQKNLDVLLSYLGQQQIYPRVSSVS